MASSGKKGKKNKGTVISLQSFLANGDTPSGTTQVSKKIRNVDGEDSDDGGHHLVYQLPTAPRANRIFDDDSIPHKAPFIAYVTNLPFDANEDDVYEFFESFTIVSLRLPREEGETGRVRGFGYVEFETRDDLINVLSLPDPSIKGRRIRVELSNEHEQQSNRQRGNRRGFDGFGNSGENRDSTNWRRDNQNPEAGSVSNNYDRGFNRDRERKYNNDDTATPGSWRTGGRAIASDLSPRSDRGNERSRDYSFRNRMTDRGEDRDRNIPKFSNEDDSMQERPKLNLKPRTLPLPEIVTKNEIETDVLEKNENEKQPKAIGAPSEKVFGSAKPVDTASRELEIEERLSEARRLESLKQENDRADVDEKLSEMHLEKTEKENANSAISWRRRNDSRTDDNVDDKMGSPDRMRTDERRSDNRDKDFNRLNKSRERSDRPEIPKAKPNQNRDVKPKDELKLKRDGKSERVPPKQQSRPIEPIVQCSNKYSGLDDEASD